MPCACVLFTRKAAAAAAAAAAREAGVRLLLVVLPAADSLKRRVLIALARGELQAVASDGAGASKGFNVAKSGGSQLSSSAGKSKARQQFLAGLYSRSWNKEAAGHDRATSSA